MPLTLTKIIEEADIRVPNSFDEPKKVDWLNEVNNLFFDVVKIPTIEKFNAVAGTAEYTLSSKARSKNIDKVIVGTTKYQSIQYEDVEPGRNYWVFDDLTKKITLEPAPLATAAGIARIYQIGTTTFVSGTLTAVPDAPDEYHWLYVLGLCERMAKAQDDAVKANNYAVDFRNGLLTAAQNYQKIGG